MTPGPGASKSDLRHWIATQQRAFEAQRAELNKARASAQTWKEYFDMATKRCRNQKRELRRLNRLMRVLHLQAMATKEQP